MSALDGMPALIRRGQAGLALYGLGADPAAVDAFVLAFEGSVREMLRLRWSPTTRDLCLSTVAGDDGVGRRVLDAFADGPWPAPLVTAVDRTVELPHDIVHVGVITGPDRARPAPRVEVRGALSTALAQRWIEVSGGTPRASKDLGYVLDALPVRRVLAAALTVGEPLAYAVQVEVEDGSDALQGLWTDLGVSSRQQKWATAVHLGLRRGPTTVVSLSASPDRLEAAVTTSYARVPSQEALAVLQATTDLATIVEPLARLVAASHAEADHVDWLHVTARDVEPPSVAVEVVCGPFTP